MKLNFFDTLHILTNTEFSEEGGLATTPIFGLPAYVSSNNYFTPSPPDPNSSPSSSTTFINTCPPSNSSNQSSYDLISGSPSPSAFNTTLPIRNASQSSLQSPSSQTLYFTTSARDADSSSSSSQNTPSPYASPDDTSPMTPTPSNNQLSSSSLVLSLLSPTSLTCDTSSSFEPVPLSLPLSFAINGDITSFANFENSYLESILQQLQSE